MDKTFAKIIQATRKEKGWTVKEFIEKLGGKLSPTYITKIEVNGEIPSPTLIYKLSSVLEIDITELLGIAKEEKIRQFEAKIDKRYKI